MDISSLAALAGNTLVAAVSAVAYRSESAIT
jgi:hypothetical protein